MSSYVITGASRGIGVGLAQYPDHTSISDSYIGTVRISTTALNQSSKYRHRPASEATARITGGTLDYLIANGARLPEGSAFVSFGEMGKNPAALEEELIANCKTNVVGNVHLFNLFMPLILNGQQKKVIAISSGHADLDLISKYEIEVTGPYAVGKAATNAVVSKFSAEYAKDGVLFMSISPGVVETGHFNPAELTEKELQIVGALAAKFQTYAPHFQGPMTPEASVKQVISVYEKASLANGDGGSFVSHLGTKQWL
ncbi:Uncharacterized protein BP5553_06501 [Venustampulla echinocandica]|uniref:NAD(P)-binding Rossmann-fold containing protein n=1 Tax=Venustampulla echinocandica TaxID=2656787 RepID=A0A370TK43_9HELO|nr:Uncharacterized protein BP5553_06501 [Venustampulla echinocandica]RDL35889.1 Uncharacterized protein BP5553_06501 [Venustampulla echinocandica]